MTAAPHPLLSALEAEIQTVLHAHPVTGCIVAIVCILAFTGGLVGYFRGLVETPKP